MKISKEFIAPLITLRQSLHACAEIAGKEKQTAELIRSFLGGCQPTEIKTNIGGHGLLAIFDSGKPGPAILFRSELDALPIAEINDISHKSVNAGVSHKCGHDGHMAILCGLGAALKTDPPLAGKIMLLFQPAEETGEGAEMICNDAQFTEVPDFVFALHNIPGAAEGLVVVKDGTFSAAVNSVVIKLQGKPTHAAQPESGINPSTAIGEIMMFCDQLSNNEPASKDFRLITPIHINLGSKDYGTAAGDGEIHFTIRTWDNEALRRLEKVIEDAVATISAKAKLKYSIAYTQGFYANTNNCEANMMVKNAAAICDIVVQEKDTPFRWGEDFGFFTSKYKGCMFGLGAGAEHADLHNPDYDFPDSLISTGVKIFYTISKSATEKNV